MRRNSILAVASHVEIEGTPAEPHLMQLAEEGMSMGGNMVLGILPLIEAMVALLKFRRAETLAREALTRAAGRLRRMFAHAALGDATLRLGEAYWEESESSFREALRLGEEIGSVVGQAVGLNGLGKVAFVRGCHEDAAAYFARALEISRGAEIGRYAARAERLLEEAREAAGAEARAVPA
jgi:tetratricopeptide (TPR) repeat protein